MPVVFRDGGLRYFFFSNEGQPAELAPILRIVSDRRDLILRAWHDYFGD